MGCKMKIDSLFEKLDGAADAQWDLKVVTKSLLMSEAWKRWGGERDRTYKPQYPLQPQGLFYKLLQEAQSILTENTTVARLRGFRNIGREDIEFDAPHSLQQSLKSLKPDIIVVKNEHLTLNRMAFAQFQCIIEHKRGGNQLDVPNAIQDSLIRSLQTFNDGFLRQ